MSITVQVSEDAIAEIVEAVCQRVMAELDARRGPDTTWPAWMSVETTAGYLDMSVERVRKLVARREIPFVQERPGARLFFERTSLDAWMRVSAVRANEVAT